MIKKLSLIILLIIASCYVAYNKTKKIDVEKEYLDNIEYALISIYSGKNDYMVYFEKAYNIKNDELIHKIVMNELSDYDKAEFYKDKEENSFGYSYMAYGDFEKSAKQGNEIATRILFEQYYYNFEFDKAIEIAENSKISKQSYIIQELLNNKNEFLDIMHIYNNIKNKEATEYQKSIFKQFALKYKVDYNFVYNILKKEYNPNDYELLYIKYLTLDKHSSEAKKLLNKLVHNNFPLAISTYIKNNHIIELDEKLEEKVDKYSRLSYIDIFNNSLNKVNMNKLEELKEKMPESVKKDYALANFSYIYESNEIAYNKYIEIFNKGVYLEECMRKLSRLARKLNREDEIIKLTNIYEGDNNIYIKELKLDKAKTNLEKKRIALEMWDLDIQKASVILLQQTHDKKAINLYTSIIKTIKE